MNIFLKLILIIIVIVGVYFFNKNSKIPDGERGNVVGKSFNDPEILLAQKEAQSQIDFFIESLENNKDDKKYFSIKYGAKDGDIVEHMWIRVSSYKDGVFSGILANEPIEVKNIKYEDPVSVKKEEIEDWIIFDTTINKTTGGFSLKAFGLKVKE